MRNYIEASAYPLTKIGGTPIPRLILGHLPFLGESYQGPAKNREYTERFSNIHNTMRVMRRAVEGFGVTVFASMLGEGELAKLFLKAVEETAQATQTDIALIPCLRIPLKINSKPVDDYRRWVTYYKIEKETVGEELREKYLKDPVLLCREGWEERFPQALANPKPYTEKELSRLQIDYKMVESAIVELKHVKALFVELGSETDFLVLTKRLDLLSELIDRLQGDLDYKVLLAIHHAGSTIPILDRSQMKFEGYVTPMNRLGVMMFPTKELAAEALKKARKPVIAIKPLAGGRIPPQEALEYVYNDLKAQTCMIGVASEAEVEEDLEAARKILQVEK